MIKARPNAGMFPREQGVLGTASGTWIHLGITDVAYHDSALR
jgi:hypothetical protein